MTGMVLTDAKLAMDEVIMISQADVDTEKGGEEFTPVSAFGQIHGWFQRGVETIGTGVAGYFRDSWNAR